MGDVLLSKDGGKTTRPFPEELVPEAARLGWELAGKTRTITGEGQTVLPGSARELGGLIEQGGSLEGIDAQRAAGNESRSERKYGDSPITAAGLGLASGLSLGTLDAAVEALGSDEARRFLRETATRNRGAYIAGQVGSALIPGALASKGGLLARAVRFTPAGAASRLGQLAGVGVAEGLGAARAATVGGRALQLGVEGLVEGAPYGAGQALSDSVIDNKPLSAEALIGAAGSGALIGGGLGAGVGAVGGILERAAGRRLAAADSVLPRGSDLGSAEAEAFRATTREAGTAIDEAHDAAAAALDDDLVRLEGGVGRRFSVEAPAVKAKNLRADAVTAELDAVQRQLGNKIAPELRADLERRQALLQVKVDEALRGTPARTIREGLTREEAIALQAESRSQGTRALVKAGPADPAGLKALEEARGLRAELTDARAGVDDLLHKDPTVRRWHDEGINDLIAGNPEKFRQFRSAANTYHDVVRRAAGAKAPGALGKLDTIAAKLGAVPEAGERFAGLSSIDLLAAANQAGVVDVNDIPVVGPVADLLLKGRLLFHTGPGMLGAGARAALPGMVARGVKGGRLRTAFRNSIQRSVSINAARGSMLKKAGAALIPGFAGKVVGDIGGGLHGAIAGASAKSAFDGLAGIGVAAEKSARALEHKIAASVTSFIKAKRVARKLVPASVTILDKVHFGGASPKQSKRGQTPYQKRAAELREAMANLPATQHHLATTLEPIRQASPQLFDLMYQTAMRRLKFLAMKLPRNPGQGSMINGYRDYEPPRYEQMRFARYVAAAESPLSVLDNLAAGAVTPEEVEALKAIYPETFRATQLFLVQYLPTHADQVGYDRRVQLGILFGVAADSSMRPDFVQSIQQLYAQEAQKELNASAQVRSSASAKIVGETMTAAQRLAGGRA